MHCHNCGSTNPEAVKFCFECGTQLRRAKDAGQADMATAIPFAKPADAKHMANASASVVDPPVAEKLRQENERLRQQLAATRQAKERAVPMAKVPKWAEWRETTPLMMTDNPGVLLAMVVVGVFTVGVVAIVVGIFLTCARRNRYRLECMEICIRGEDHVQGEDFALAIGKAGVDHSRVAAALAKLAEAAMKNADPDAAMRIYQRAAKRWKSAHARRALERLGREQA